MPWKVIQRGEQYCVIKKDTGETVKCHPTRDKAIAHQQALYSNYEKEQLAIESELKRGKSLFEVKGGAGSGNFGHAGRPGLVGGSASDGGSNNTEHPEASRPTFTQISKVTGKNREGIAYIVDKTFGGIAAGLAPDKAFHLAAEDENFDGDRSDVVLDRHSAAAALKKFGVTIKDPVKPPVINNSDRDKFDKRD